MRHQISIIIPVLNEEATIAKLLQHLLENSLSKNISEIIIVDGGSTDETMSSINTTSNAIKKSYPDFNKIQVINSSKGRAKQMNLGSKKANGDILYFLHVDSFPPKDFDQLIINEVTKGNHAGCFRMQFDSKHWWLKFASWFTQFNWKFCRGGDQSQFITKTLFENIGGYNENYVIYEDNVLIKKLYACKQFVVINKTLKTSARLYEKHGIWKLQYHFLRIHLMHFFGASSDKLLGYYKRHIA